jgi:ADP-ribose pyrophosphatase YjhB (NUDIX family)
MKYTDQRRVCVRGVIYKDGKLFCQELKDKQGNGRGFWCTPGGGLNAKESLVSGTARELFEETGVHAKVGKLLFVQTFADSNVGPHGEQETMEFFSISLTPKILKLSMKTRHILKPRSPDMGLSTPVPQICCQNFCAHWI